MTLNVHRKTSKQLLKRRSELTEELLHLCSELEGSPCTRPEVNTLADRGRLSPEERDLYDELRHVEMLLEP